jgi:hypothetical protein
MPDYRIERDGRSEEEWLIIALHLTLDPFLALLTALRRTLLGSNRGVRVPG